MIYYHIRRFVNNTFKPLNLGDKIDSSQTFNYWYKNLIEQTHGVQMHQDKAVTAGEYHNALVSNNASPTSDEYQRLVQNKGNVLREVIFENTRHLKFSQKPSRLKALYVADSQASLQYWKKQLLEKAQPSSFQILELEMISGKTHHGIEKYTNSYDLSAKSIENNALNYWTDTNLASHYEVLVEGVLEVKKIL